LPNKYLVVFILKYIAMNKDLGNALDNFMEDESMTELQKKNKKEVILQNNFSIIERVDKVYLVEDGRQLLREQY